MGNPSGKEGGRTFPWVLVRARGWQESCGLLAIGHSPQRGFRGTVSGPRHPQGTFSLAPGRLRTRIHAYSTAFHPPWKSVADLFAGTCWKTTDSGFRHSAPRSRASGMVQGFRVTGPASSLCHFIFGTLPPIQRPFTSSNLRTHSSRIPSLGLQTRRTGNPRFG